jgi:hypothetical protein
MEGGDGNARCAGGADSGDTCWSALERSVACKTQHALRSSMSVQRCSGCPNVLHHRLCTLSRP